MYIYIHTYIIPFYDFLVYLNSQKEKGNCFLHATWWATWLCTGF